MKKNKIFAVLSVFMLICAMAFCITACGDNSEDDGPKYADHKVEVVDTLGNPIKDVLVKFVGKDGTDKTRVTGEDGIATYKNALVGNFTIELQQGTSEAVIDKNDFEFGEDETELKIVIRNGKTSMDIFGDTIPNGGYAGTVSAGEYKIPAGKTGMDYYVFSANTAGMYKVSITSSNKNTKVGYYGNPMVVRSDDIFASRAQNGEKMTEYELVIQEVGPSYVIGVDRADTSAFTIKIERIGDAPFDEAYLPWNHIESTESFSKCVISSGTILTDLDITNPNLSVTLSNGRYYTNDGKLVYIRIKSASKYWEFELARLVGQMDDTTGINIGGYLYDKDGNFVDKYSYNGMIVDYIEYCDDENGVYPLTEELAEAIKFHGERAGWWNAASGNYLFADYNIVTENAWLFMCCVAE